MTILLKSKDLAQRIQQNIKEEVQKYKDKPSITVIIVGDNPASKVYVAKKNETAKAIGINSVVVEFDENVSQQVLEEKIQQLNEDTEINAILVQLPLPKHINTDAIIEKISPEKDVDGFHPLNMGKLLTGLTPYALPCTPAGIMRLFEEYNISLDGKNAVVIGRSNIVGKPVSVLMLEKNTTVTICHSRTKNLKDITNKADIVISAMGRPKFVMSDFIKEGAVVIDVGTFRTEEGKLSGDVDFSNVKEKTSYITPVPGGVGPMTIAILMENTLNLYKLQKGIK